MGRMKLPWMFLAGDVERVVDALPVAIVMTDDERRIVASNQAALELFGFGKEELLGQKLEILLPERFASRHPRLYSQFLKDPSTRPMGHGRELAARKKNGQEFPVEVGLTVLNTEPPFYLASVVDLTFRKQVEGMLKDRQQYLEATLEDTRKLLEEQVASSTRLEERQRLGRELHDTLSQSLYGIGLGLRTAMAKVDNGTDPTDALSYCLNLTESALLEMRALLFKLRPQSLEGVPLADVLEGHAEAVGARTELKVTFQHRKDCAEELEFDRKYAIYRITTEALHNCIKHAREASEVNISLVSSPDQVTVTVRDNGPGFSEMATGGHGMRTMQERAEAAQGTFEVKTGQGGTTITATVPRGPCRIEAPQELHEVR